MPDQFDPPAGEGAQAVRRALEADLARRLGAVCEAWPPERFAALVRDIAGVQLRWAARAREDGPAASP